VVSPVVNMPPVITAQPTVVATPAGHVAAIPVEYLLASLAALGTLERIKIKKIIWQKLRVTVGA
ncbi:MAG: hypothetical protein J7L88_05745, partial [Thermoplasmata archaeon]|nr:hypothetical protein [Thermoplasmata archaeon]